MNYNLSGINGLQSVQKNQAALVNRTTPVSNIANSVTNSTSMSAMKTQQTYLIQEAPRQFLNLLRSRQGTGAYQAELQRAEFKDAVDQLHAGRMGFLLTDMKQSESESGYILKHLNKLNAERSKFMASQEYDSLPWLNAPTEAEEALAGPVEEAAPAERGANKPEDDTEDTREVNAAREQQAATPATLQTAAATANPPVDTGIQGTVQAHTIAANLIT